MAKAKLVGEVEGLGKIVVSNAPLDSQIQQLKSAGAEFPHLITLRDVAYMRLHDGPKDATRACHAPIYAKDSPIVLAMISPLIEDMKMAEQAVKANRKGSYFVTLDTEVYDKYAEMAEADKSKEPVKRRALFLPERKVCVIQKGSETAQVLFQDVEEQYFDKFVRDGIKFYPIDASFVDVQKGTAVDYLWFWHPVDGSVLDGDGRSLSNGCRAFGVLKETGEASSQKILAYTKSDLRNAEKELARLRKFLQPEQIKDLENLIAKLIQ